MTPQTRRLVLESAFCDALFLPSDFASLNSALSADLHLPFTAPTFGRDVLRFLAQREASPEAMTAVVGVGLALILGDLLPDGSRELLAWRFQRGYCR